MIKGIWSLRFGFQFHWLIILATLLMDSVLQSKNLPARPSSQIVHTPIEHLIVVIGENHSFDSLFATYVPPSGASIRNLQYQGIVDRNGQPSSNYHLAQQRVPLAPSLTFRSDIPKSETAAMEYLIEPGCQPRKPDARLPDRLPNGPFPITDYLPYARFSGNPIHRFFQMWQQYNGGRNDLFAWVSLTAGNGPHNWWPSPYPDCYEAAIPMGFYNMNKGDVPVFRYFADQYAIADNYHQSVMGGSGPNFAALVTGDMLVSVDPSGRPEPPPSAFLNGKPVSQIEDPDPDPAAWPENYNWYKEDGYAGGSYVACADLSAPGVRAITDYLQGKGIDPLCDPGIFYLVNNQSPGYTVHGQQRDFSSNPFFVRPQPRSIRTIAESLAEAGVSWKYYSGDRGDGNRPPGSDYCDLCDPFTFFSGIMENPGLRAQLQDLENFFLDIEDQNLPAVSFVRPAESESGHPASASLQKFEALMVQVVTSVQADPDLWRKTAILITMDEGGGYYDSGPIQALDFFGDGSRVPLLLVSPHARKGHVDHTYYDHASVLKFIQYNWGLDPLTQRSRDRLPNPIMGSAEDPYLPVNSPAIGDLLPLFDFN